MLSTHLLLFLAFSTLISMAFFSNNFISVSTTTDVLVWGFFTSTSMTLSTDLLFFLALGDDLAALYLGLEPVDGTVLVYGEGEDGLYRALLAILVL